VLQDRGVEIGLPVLSDWRSQALFRIPATWRDGDEPAAPPPIDPAKRFGIRFDRLGPSDRKRNPWTEGYLSVPGLRLELPVGWWPKAALRSENGFPVRFLDETRRTVGWVDRLEKENRLIGSAESMGWKPVKRAARFHATKAYEKENGSRLLVAHEGHAFVFLTIETHVPRDPTYWKRLVDSALLLRLPRRVP